MGESINWKVFLLMIILAFVSAHRKFYWKNDEIAEIFDIQLWERVWNTWTNYLPGMFKNADQKNLTRKKLEKMYQNLYSF